MAIRQLSAMVEKKSLVKIDSFIGQAQVIRVVLDGLPSEHSKRAYERALRDFLVWHHRQGQPALGKATVQAYVAELRAVGVSPATINQRLAAIRKLVTEAADNGALDQQTANMV